MKNPNKAHTSQHLSLGALRSVRIDFYDDESITLTPEDLAVRIRMNRFTTRIKQKVTGLFTAPPEPTSITLTKEQARQLGDVLKEPKAGGARLLAHQLKQAINE